MAMMMFISSNKKIMGRFLIQGVLRYVGWGATGIMAAAAIVMIATAVFEGPCEKAASQSEKEHRFWNAVGLLARKRPWEWPFPDVLI